MYMYIYVPVLCKLHPGEGRWRACPGEPASVLAPPEAGRSEGGAAWAAGNSVLPPGRMVLLNQAYILYCTCMIIISNGYESVNITTTCSLNYKCTDVYTSTCTYMYIHVPTTPLAQIKRSCVREYIN